jgi:hypothetical protein
MAFLHWRFGWNEFGFGERKSSPERFRRFGRFAHPAELIPILLIRTLPLSLDEEVNQVAQKILGLSLGALRSQVDDLLAQVFGRFRHRGVGVIEEGIEGFLGECDLGIRQVDHESVLLTFQSFGPALSLCLKTAFVCDAGLLNDLRLGLPHFQKRHDFIGSVLAFALPSRTFLPWQFLHQNLRPVGKVPFPETEVGKRLKKNVPIHSRGQLRQRFLHLGLLHKLADLAVFRFARSLKIAGDFLPDLSGLFADLPLHVLNGLYRPETLWVELISRHTNGSGHSGKQLSGKLAFAFLALLEPLGKSHRLELINLIGKFREDLPQFIQCLLLELCGIKQLKRGLFPIGC